MEPPRPATAVVSPDAQEGVTREVGAARPLIGPRSTVDAAGLADAPVEGTVPFDVAMEAFEQALTEDLSAEDAVVLRMSYAELLESAGEPGSAELYAQITRIAPDTPLGRQAGGRLVR